MKFKYSLSPNYNSSVDTKEIMRNLMFALIFVAICSVVLQYVIYGVEGAIRAVLILSIAVVTCTAVDYLYFKALKVDKSKLKDKISENVPAVTGIILALCLPLGDLKTFDMLYITFICSIAAELIGKLIYGGFGYNLFNPAGVGRAFAALAFGQYLVVPAIDGLASSTPLTALASSDGLEAARQTFTNYASLLFGAHGGSVGETIIVPIILAGAYLVYKKVIDWVIPVVSIGTIGVLATIFSVMGGFDMDFVIVHVLSGGLVFGAVFMLTDPVTNPNNRQGKVIFAIVFALLTFLIRAKASLPEGVVFSILIVNMLVPLIDRYTSNVTNKDTGKKVLSIAVTAVVAIGLTVLFYFV